MSNPTCPFAHQRLLARSKPLIHPTASAAHTAVTSANGQQLGDFFEHADADAHFYVDHDGSLWQYLPVNRKSWAQYRGNDHAVSYETWDGGHPETPWNDAQVATIVRLLRWLHDDWGISLDTATRDDGPGVAYHSQFPSWNLNAHQCPGTVRVRQLVQQIIPLTHQPEDDLTPEQDQRLHNIEDMLNGLLHGAPQYNLESVPAAVTSTHHDVKAIADHLGVAHD